MPEKYRRIAYALFGAFFIFFMYKTGLALRRPGGGLGGKEVTNLINQRLNVHDGEFQKWATLQFAPRDSASSSTSTEEVAALRKEVESLRGEIASLRGYGVRAGTAEGPKVLREVDAPRSKPQGNPQVKEDTEYEQEMTKDGRAVDVPSPKSSRSGSSPVKTESFYEFKVDILGARIEGRDIEVDFVITNTGNKDISVDFDRKTMVYNERGSAVEAAAFTIAGKKERQPRQLLVMGIPTSGVMYFGGGEPDSKSISLLHLRLNTGSHGSGELKFRDIPLARE